MAEEVRRPARVGKYKLLKLVDEDASGKLYRARDTETNRQVLLRVRGSGAAGTERAYDELASYDVPTDRAPAYPPYAAPRGTHPATVVAVGLGMLLTGILGYALGVYSTRSSAIIPPGSLLPVGRPALPGAGTQHVATTGQADEGEEAGTASAEPAAELALEEAQAQWERLRSLADYERGAQAFQNVRDKHAGTSAASRAGALLGRLYREWGATMERQRDYALAVDKYKQALALLDADSQEAKLTRSKLPAALLKAAQAERANGEFARAAEYYAEAARCEETDEGTAQRLLERASMLSEDMRDYDEAIRGLNDIVERFPGTRAAATGAKKLSDVYLAAARHALEQGKPERVMEFLAALTDKFPEREGLDEVQEIRAEALFRGFEIAKQQNDVEGGRRLYGQLFKSHADSKWTIRALRLRLGYRGAQPTYSDERARALLDMEVMHRQQRDYFKAIQGLESIIRAAPAESPALHSALAYLPAWLYEAALRNCGVGKQKESLAGARRLLDLFPYTRWADRAEGLQMGLTNPPKGMVYVPEGSFIAGTTMEDAAEILRARRLYQGEDEEDMIRMAAEADILQETPAQTLSVGAFFIDRCEVTNAQYSRFVKEMHHRLPSHWKGGKYPDGQGDVPVVNVSLADAQAYAAWRGARLPTEAEWEKAARGVDGRAFPWGADFAADRCNHMQPRDAGPKRVGSYANGASPYGCLDMIGNVSEWTSSDFKPYPGSRMVLREAEAHFKVVRGGPWFDATLTKIPARCASRIPSDPNEPQPDVGFRCVVSVPGPGGAAGPIAED